MHKTRVGVIRGGPSSEHAVSLNTGGNVLSAIRKYLDGSYQARDVFIDKSGVWHMDGVAVSPEEAVRKMDVAFNALHGSYGEDGKLQSFLEAHGLPFTGSGSLGSAIGMNKVLSKKVFRDHGLQTPSWRELASDAFRDNRSSVMHDLFNTFLLPAVVKPVGSGSSVGVSIVRTYPELEKALEEAAKHGDAILLEEYIPGAEATCGVVEGFRGQDIYALPPIEIRPKTGFFDHAAKYEGQSEEIVPATFPEKIKSELASLAMHIHSALGLRHYSRSDFIIHPRRGIYVLEVNTLPGLTNESLIPKALRAVGSDTHEFVDHVLGLALKRQ